MTSDQDRLTALRDFAARYTAAWCSQDPANVAAFFAPAGSLTIAESLGHYDASEYQRQIEHGAD